MLTLSVAEARLRMQQLVGKTVYLHVEDNPTGYLRNIAMHLKAVHIHGEGPYRLYLEWQDPDGVLQFNDMTDFYTDEDALICTAYDSQSRISHSVEMRNRPFPV